MSAFRVMLLLALGLVLAACGSSKFQRYDGPAVTSVLIDKSDRRIWLFSGQDVLETYPVDLGFAPVGHKQFEGDGKTPEGRYTIDRRNPNSRYHLSVGIDYPNAADRAYAASQGKDPGGEIFIHGVGSAKGNTPKDWTLGCIAVTDRQIERIYAMVKDGTPITIRP